MFFVPNFLIPLVYDWQVFCEPVVFVKALHLRFCIKHAHHVSALHGISNNERTVRRYAVLVSEIDEIFNVSMDVYLFHVNLFLKLNICPVQNIPLPIPEQPPPENRKDAGHQDERVAVVAKEVQAAIIGGAVGHGVQRSPIVSVARDESPLPRFAVAGCGVSARDRVSRCGAGGDVVWGAGGEEEEE